MRLTLASLAAVFVASAVPAARGDGGVEFFEKKVRPVLVQHCYKCHSAGAKKRKGGLALDTRDAARKGGDSGPAVVPGRPEASLLVRAVRHADEALKMPPAGKLPDDIVADLEAWVRMGAPDPRDVAAPAGAATVSWEEMLRTRRQWWSLQPVREPAVPAVKDAAWPDSPVDRFLLAKLEQAGLTPAPEADRRTLVRRLSLVLTGLPPAPGEVEAFAGDAAPGAYGRLVDRLLASPHFGERWTRHWMDVVRFSETHGNEWNYEVHHAWRYRDYLIRAFNADVPYDRLVREHIAGDLLPDPRPGPDGASNESVIGTAFYRFGEANHDDCIALRQIGYDLADNQIDTLGKAFQATTVACARCHDHKLDAVSMKDYYALLGVLRSSRQVSHTIDAPAVNAGPVARLRELKAEIRRELGAVWQREARDIGRYLLAAEARRSGRPDAAELAAGLDVGRVEAWAAALKAEKQPLEDLLQPWRLLTTGPAGFEAAWHPVEERYLKETRERAEFNRAQFVAFGPDGWQAGGHGLRDGASPGGDFAPAADGDAVVQAVLPAGWFTHALSQRLNGTLRSPILPRGKKRISFEVMGRHGAAVRLVSNNCQLNYRNYRALTSADPGWVTFEVSEEADTLRAYAELVTMLDNPKFPDQLSALGGDKDNYRLPWEQAVADGRSFFGVTRVVLHDGPEHPRPELGHLRPLFAGGPPRGPAEVAARYASAAESAARAWAEGRATDDDVRWLDALLRRKLLGNSARLAPRLAALAAQYRAVEKELATPRVVPGVADFGPGCEQPVFARGEWSKPGEPVPRRYLEVLSRPGDRFGPDGSGRRELAERIASADNPLTARVMVNRVWHHLFGAGIVRTVDDFGRVGDTPSHPELLDYLAARFVRDGWSVKLLVRQLVLTRAFRADARPSPEARERDPENRLLQHYPARRMEAEAVRDAVLAASGRLDRALYGPSVPPYREKDNPDRRLFVGPLDGRGRRSVYVKNSLMEAPRFLRAFNLPGGKVAQGRRDVTNVPAQALAMLNDPFVLGQADAWAERLAARPDGVAARVDAMFRAALGRPPTADESARFARAVARFAELRGVPAGAAPGSREVWRDVTHTVFNLQEFITIP
jgi:hypothetical protein